MPSNHLVLCCSRLLLPSIFPSIRVFANKLAFCIRWPEYWSFSFSISPSNECSGLISFRIDLFDLLAVQGTQESSPTPQLQASVLPCSAFFMVQLSHPYMTTGKTMKVKVKVVQSCPTLCNPTDCSPWNSPGQNTGVGSLSLLQGVFLTQESIQGLLHCRWILYQLSYQGKTITLTRRTFVGKVMSLHFNILPRLVITFLPRSKRLLLSWLS